MTAHNSSITRSLSIFAAAYLRAILHATDKKKANAGGAAVF
jgi:hypothetical protein